MRRRSRLAACGVGALLALPLAWVAQAPEGRSAPGPPVLVLVVFDEFPTTSLLGGGGRIDAVRYPNFAALVRGSTWFPNATTVHDSTFYSVPAILDGRRPRKGRQLRNLFTLLAGHGYAIRGSEEATRLCPRRLCGARRPARYYLNHGRLGRLDRFFSGIHDTRRPAFHFKQTLLPHGPWIYLPSGRQYQHGPVGPIRDLMRPVGSRERTLVRLAHQRHLLQLGAVDRELGELVRRLRETGLYDRALIVLTADHGVSFRRAPRPPPGRPPKRDWRDLDRANAQDIASVPLFVKRPGQRRGEISSAYARTVDVVPTIADVLGIKIPWRTVGRSVFSRAVRRRRTVRLAGKLRPQGVALGAREFRRRLRGSLRRQQTVFGYGNRGPGLYGVGPHRELIGRPTAELRILRSRRVRARVFDGRDLRGVRRDSGFVPSLILGRIGGARAGARRDLAIAVNGRIQAVTRTFYLWGHRDESFAALVPESALLEGSNRVAIVGVSGRRSALRFRLLGGV